MNKKLMKSFLLVLLAVVILSTTALAGVGMSINWSTIDGGGGQSTGGDYSLQGTIGQPDAAASSAGDFSLSGGFWNEVKQSLLSIFLPIVIR